MKIKHLFIALLLSLPFLAQAIGPYKVGDVLINHAQSGLLLRKSPNAKGERIANIPFGESVTVVKNNQPKKPHQIQEFKGFTIKGYWVKVKTKDGLEGFVFDGYLSSYPAAVKVVDDQNERPYCTAELYVLGKSELKGARIDLPKHANHYDHYRQLFKNGASVEFTGGEGGSTQEITFEKGVSVEEAYLIGKSIWLKGMKTIGSADNNSLHVSDDGEIWHVNVASKGGITVLTLGHAD
jgi:hypothetical protein